VSTPRAATATTLGLAFILVASCGGPPPTQGIVFLSLDTTRADRLGCYGYESAETPNLDALAAEGVLFLQAQSPVPVTLPSHATMFTGTYPPKHGIRYNGMFRLDETSVTVAELLRDAGWSTAGAPAAFPMAASTGIGQGFQEYFDMFAEGPVASRTITAERNAADTTSLGIEFLERSAGVRFFLWLHYWDPHYPYEPAFPYSSSHRDRPYDGEIAYVDLHIGKLFDALKDLDLWDRTLVVVVGDHGEGLYEHNEKMHANLVYQTTLRVPLIVKAPGARPREIEEPVSLADLAPTILDIAGVAGPEMDGISLESVIYGKENPPTRDIYFESLSGSLVYGWSPLEGVRRGPWKYVRSGSPELFDLADDPSEARNVHDVEGDRAAELEESLRAFEEDWQRAAATASTAPTPLSSAEADALAALGYLGGSVAEDARGGPDPRELIHLEIEAFAARDQMAARDYDGALQRIDRILVEDPTNRYALAMAAQMALRMGDYDRALEVTARTLELYPEHIPSRLVRGEVFILEGDLERAAETFRAGLEYSPEDAGLVYRLAASLYGLDRIDEVREIIDPVIDDPANRFPWFRVLRAACRAKRADPSGALEDLRIAIENGYRDRETLETEPVLEPLRAVAGFEDVVGTIPASDAVGDDAGAAW